MMQRLRTQNYEAVFLDFDGERGIAAGKDWEAELYRNLSICRAAIVLLSEKWIASRWCFAEFCLAKALGKEIFPVRIASCRADAFSVGYKLSICPQKESPVIGVFGTACEKLASILLMISP
jgi:hypothetical protein